MQLRECEGILGLCEIWKEDPLAARTINLNLREEQIGVKLFFPINSEAVGGF